MLKIYLSFRFKELLTSSTRTTVCLMFLWGYDNSSQIYFVTSTIYTLTYAHIGKQQIPTFHNQIRFIDSRYHNMHISLYLQIIDYPCFHFATKLMKITKRRYGIIQMLSLVSCYECNVRFYPSRIPC